MNKEEAKQKLLKLVGEYYLFYTEIPLREHYWWVFHISQNLDEIVELMLKIGDKKFKHFVEIGTSCGGSLWLYANLFCDENTKIESIDPRNQPRPINFTVNKLKERNFNVVFYNKHSYDIKNEISNDIDLLHIDGDHVYESVKLDWELYFPKVIKNGIVLVHDAKGTHAGAKRFGDELQYNPKIKSEIIALDEYACGIGYAIKL